MELQSEVPCRHEFVLQTRISSLSAEAACRTPAEPTRRARTEEDEGFVLRDSMCVPTPPRLLVTLAMSPGRRSFVLKLIECLA